VYTHFGSVDVHPFTFDEFAQAFHEKDSLLLGEVHIGLLKLLLLNAEMGSGGVFAPRSSKDCRFLSFLNFVSFLKCLLYFSPIIKLIIALKRPYRTVSNRLNLQSFGGI